MSDRDLLREEPSQQLTRARWLILVVLAALALTLTLVVSSQPPSQAAVSVEQERCDPDGQPPFGMFPADVEATVFTGNMVNLVGCLNPATPVAASDAEPEVTNDHGLTEPMALH
jgi:hypothetical protein